MAEETIAVIKRDEQQAAQRRDRFDLVDELWDLPWPLGFRRLTWPRQLLARTAARLSPRVDIYEQGNELVITADLPGMKKEDVTVELDQGDLVIRGEHKAESEVREEDYYRMERSFGSFYRRIPMPADLQAEQIAARYHDGVLEVRVPKPAGEQAKASSIPIR